MAEQENVPAKLDDLSLTPVQPLQKSNGQSLWLVSRGLSYYVQIKNERPFEGFVFGHQFPLWAFLPVKTYIFFLVLIMIFKNSVMI